MSTALDLSVGDLILDFDNMYVIGSVRYDEQRNLFEVTAGSGGVVTLWLDPTEELLCVFGVWCRPPMPPARGRAPHLRLVHSVDEPENAEKKCTRCGRVYRGRRCLRHQITFNPRTLEVLE